MSESMGTFLTSAEKGEEALVAAGGAELPAGAAEAAAAYQAAKREMCAAVRDQDAKRAIATAADETVFRAREKLHAAHCELMGILDAAAADGT